MTNTIQGEQSSLSLQERLRWLGGAAALEAADEIDRLQSKLKDSQSESARLERELSDARQAIGLLTTLAPQMEIDPSRPLDMAQEIVKTVAAKDERIEELEDKKYEVSLDEDQHIITTEQINEAWQFGRCFLGPARNNLLKQLSLIGIVPCPKCGGTKRVGPMGPSTVSGSGLVQATCDCPNNGWVIE